MSSAGISSFDINATNKLSLVLVQFEEMAEKNRHENVNRAKFYIDYRYRYLS